MWWNDYVGIPFLDKGRNRSGIDCWGLARLIYSEQFDIELPSFATEYSPDDRSRMSELISQYREGWTETTEPKPGSIILFKILGADSHIGVYLGQDKFIHARDGHSVAIETLQSPAWRSRVVGFFNYTEKSFAVLNARPHPLKTERWTVPVAPGTTIEQLSKQVLETCKVSKELESSVVIILNGRVVNPLAYSSTVIYDNDVLEYRAVPGKNALNVILLIAVIVIAVSFPQFAASIGSFIAPGAAVGVQTAIGMAVINTVGQLLIGAIAPIRPPEGPNDPGTSRAQLLFNGGSNQINKYGAIPVVLGKVRMTAPLGAQNYVNSNAETSYLNMLLVWGFGPLQVTDYAIGANEFNQFENGLGKPIEYATLNDTVTPDTLGDVVRFNRIYGSDIKQVYSGIELAANLTIGEVIGVGVPGPWTEVTIEQDAVSKIDVSFHFPQGLRTLIVKGDRAGQTQAKTCKLDIEYRQVDASNNPLSSWDNSSLLRVVGIRKIQPVPNLFNIVTNVLSGGKVLQAARTSRYVYSYSDDGQNIAYTNYYRWYRIAVTTSGTAVVRSGALTESPYAEPSAAFITLQKSSTYGYGTPSDYVRLPKLASTEIPIVDICLFGTTIFAQSTAARLAANISTTYGTNAPPVNFANYTYSGFAITTEAEQSVRYEEQAYGWDTAVYTPTGNIIAGYDDGIIARNVFIGAESTLVLGDNEYVNRKDAFTHTHTIPVAPGRYQVRARRVDNDNSEPDDTNRHLHAVNLQTVTGISNLKPVKAPPGCVLTQTALSIKATDQLNGNLEGINALVQTICLDWNAATSSWILRPTNNPASLFIYVLTHPAFARRITNQQTATKVNLPALQNWHTFCETRGFTFNGVVAQQRSVLEVLKDIAAAGRASPAMVDGKWTVIIDTARTDIVQHFTPHNSWDFSATKQLPRIPDALKVLYNNEDKGYQEEELIVYNSGKSEANSELFEQIYLPGTTNKSQAFIHARWHLAQAKLRPEVYTINTDLEYLVCNRGDRVKVVHDVPLWGLGSGRIKTRLTANTFELSEEVGLEANILYTIRVRSSTTGASVTKNVVPVSISTYTNRIAITTTSTADEINNDDLFLFGTLNSESNDLLVLAIEPFGNQNAKITLVDYAADLYDINYLSNTFTVPNFDSNITKPPANLVQSIAEKPVITRIVSDETVMEEISPGIFRYNIKVSFTNPQGLPTNVAFCEAQLDNAADTVENWETSLPTKVTTQSVNLTNVQEGSNYRIRLRYVGLDGRFGNWTDTVTHVVVGKTNPPGSVTGFNVEPEYATGNLVLSWNENLEIDIRGYEVRTENANWGTTTNLAARVFKGNADTCVSVPAALGATKTFYIKAYDYGNNYSVLATSDTYTTVAPTAPNIAATFAYADTSTTSSTVTFTWAAAPVSDFEVQKYELTLTRPDGGAVTVQEITGLTWATEANWIGTATLAIKSINILGHKSATAFTTNIIKARPSAPTGTTFTINDSQLFLDWPDVVKTTNGLPVAGYEIRATNTGWGTVGYLWKGSASNTVLKNITTGTNTYYINTFDTDNNYALTGNAVSFSPQKPGTVTGVTSVLASTSTTTSTVNIKWTAPAVTSFPVAKYLVTLTKPVPYAALSNTATIDSTNWIVPADWVGTAVLTIITIDVINNQSIASTTNIIKAVPAAPTTAVFTVSDSQLLVDWADVEPVVNGLPVAGYEIRKTNSNWGVINSDLIFSGNISNALIKNNLITGGAVNTWYINSFDTDNKYAVNGTAISYTALRPNIATNLVATINTSTTSATITLNWLEPLVTSFKIAKYTVRITKPNSTYIETTIAGTSWTVTADWAGTGTFTITTIDLLGTTSATNAVLNLSILPPAQPGIVTPKTSGTSVNLSWPTTVPTTLPIAGYELRDVDSNWGAVDANLVWKGSVTGFALSSFLLGSNIYYLRAYDLAGNYSSISRNVTVLIEAPGSLGIIINTYATGTTGSTATLRWTKPTINLATQFALDYYLITITKPGPVVTTAKSLTNEYTLAADWSGNTTVTVVAYDVLNNVSPTASIILAKLPPNPVISHTTTVQTASVLIDWPDVVKTSLPVAGYELRTSTAGWGTGGHTWKGSVSRVEIIPAQGFVQQTWYLKTFDTAGEYSATFYTINLTTAAPEQPSIPTENYTDSTSTGASITFDWTAVRGTYPIKEYFVKLTKGATIEQVTLNSTSWSTTADWLGAATIEITVYDTLGNASLTRTKALTKVAPGTPGVTTTTINTSKTGINLSWLAAAAGSLPVDGYELTPTGSTPGKVQKITGLSVDISDLTLGTNTWDLRAYDTDQRYSAIARSISYVISRPSTPVIQTTVYSTSLTNATAILKWSEPATSAFGIYKYLVSFTTTTPAQTLTSTRSTTEWEIPANWTGAGTLNVTAYDNLEIASLTATNAGVNKALPADTGAIATPTVQGTSLVLDWPDTATVANGLPILGYEIRFANSSWGSAGYIWKGSASNYTVNLTNTLRDNPGGTAVGTVLTWYLKAFDTDNRYSTNATSKSYTIAAPVNTVFENPYFEDTNLTSAVIKLKWADTLPIFGLKQYEISGSIIASITTLANNAIATVLGTNGVKGLSIGDVIQNNVNIPVGTKITGINYFTNQITLSTSSGVTAGTAVASTVTGFTYTNATAIDLPADWLGDKNFTIKTVDLLNNKSTGVTKPATKSLPGTPTNFRTQVIDNTVLLYWELPTITSLPISHIRLKKGVSWNEGELIGDKDGTFTTITELIGGNYTYWAAAVDTDSNESVPVSLATTVSAPPDYIFNALYVSTLGGIRTTYLSNTTTTLVVASTANITVDMVIHGNGYTSGQTVAAVVNSTTLITSAAPNTPPVINTEIRFGYPLPNYVSNTGTSLVVTSTAGISPGTRISGNGYTSGQTVVAVVNSTTVTTSAIPDTAPVVGLPITFGFFNVLKEANTGFLVLPVNTAESFAQHFITPGWVGPSAQVAAGYPVYIQPGLITGSYQEIFDYGTLLGSSQISVAIAGTNIAGAPQVNIIISTSPDNITYTDYAGSSSVFGTNFRYIKITVTVSQTTAGNIYQISNLTVRLDAKQKTDSGPVLCNLADVGGTVVNFNTGFVDVTSITLAPQGTTALIPVYDFKDNYATATYTLTSNLCTVTQIGHGYKTGQYIKLGFVTGGAPSSIYLITVTGANTYTATIVTANTSGTVQTYPQSMTVYLYNTSGVRQSGTVSWTVRGY